MLVEGLESFGVDRVPLGLGAPELIADLDSLVDAVVGMLEDSGDASSVGSREVDSGNEDGPPCPNPRGSVLFPCRECQARIGMPCRRPL